MRRSFIEIKDTDTGAGRRHTHEPLCTDGSPLSPGAGRVKLGFVGLSAGAGATTLAFAAAEYLAALLNKQGPGAGTGFAGRTKDKAGTGLLRGGRSVTLLELDPRVDAPAGRPYDKIGIDRRFAGRDFVSLYRLASEGKPLSGVRNIDGGLFWALRIPGEPVPGLCPAALLRLLNNVSGDIVVCDISAQGFLNGAGTGLNGVVNRDVLLALLADLDRIVCIFDPLPSRLFAAVPAAETCRAAAAAGVPVTYVFNKLNAGVNMREATRFTGIREFISFPAIPAEAVYAAEYACRSLAAEPKIKAALAALFPN